MPRTCEEVIEHLRDVQNLKVGAPLPAWVKTHGEALGFNHWALVISQLCGEAADEIERLNYSGWMEKCKWCGQPRGKVMWG